MSDHYTTNRFFIRSVHNRFGTMFVTVHASKENPLSSVESTLCYPMGHELIMVTYFIQFEYLQIDQVDLVLDLRWLCPESVVKENAIH